MTRLLGEAGLVDVYRRLHPDTTDSCYTWWSNRGQAYANNVGWRLDYLAAGPRWRPRPAWRRSTRIASSATMRR